MCGYVGFWTRCQYKDSPNLASLGLAMAKAIAHRGPDHAAVSVESTGLTIAFRRLAVVDRGPSGNQPMESTNGRYLIAFNGEIYNFRELRVQLESSGAIGWKGHSDTEVILHAIQSLGFEKALSRISGMFSFALWDRAEQTLRLARDRLGEKPLYFGWQKNSFLFGSDLAAFAKNPDFEGTVSRQALQALIVHNNVPAPLSIFEGIEKLPPGCFVSLTGAQFDRRLMPPAVAYWSLINAATQGSAGLTHCDERELTDEFEARLKSVIRRQMVADVPVGTFLSGGVDSSLVAALAQSAGGSPVKTFTIGFAEGAYDEAESALQVSRHLGTQHTSLTVSDRDARDLIPLIPQAYSEPFADSSQLPTMLISKLARSSVTVALSGDGGDEVFGGYNRYLTAEQLWTRFAKWPRSIRGAVGRSLTSFRPGQIDWLYRNFSGALPARYQFRGFGDKVHKFALAMDASSAKELYRSVSTLSSRNAGLVLGLNEVLSPEEQFSNWPESNNIQPFVSWMMAQDGTGYLPDDILVKVDRASMFYSLETRMPFLDHHLVEAAWRLPLHMKIRDGQGKWLLRRILARYVPIELIDRPKMGFGVPLEHWLRGSLREWADDLIGSDSLNREGFFDAPKIRTLWKEHLSGSANWQHHLWPILMFQQWQRASRETAQ